MADSVKVEYLYPPNMLDGDWDEQSGNKRVIVRMSCISDATGETDVTKIQMSDVKTSAGNVPGRTAVEWIEYEAVGITALLEWDRAPNAEIIRLNGNATSLTGRADWTQFGGKVDPGGDRTGDILITTTNYTSLDTYEITMCLRLKD